MVANRNRARRDREVSAGRFRPCGQQPARCMASPILVSLYGSRARIRSACSDGDVESDGRGVECAFRGGQSGGGSRVPLSRSGSLPLAPSRSPSETARSRRSRWKAYARPDHEMDRVEAPMELSGLTRKRDRGVGQRQTNRCRLLLAGVEQPGQRRPGVWSRPCKIQAWPSKQSRVRDVPAARSTTRLRGAERATQRL